MRDGAGAAARALPRWIARRAIGRGLRPHEVRQAEIDGALAAAAGSVPQLGEAVLDRLQAWAVEQCRRDHTQTLVDRPVQAHSEAGDLLLSASDKLITQHIAEHGDYEPHMTAFLGAILRPGMTFVDVGANIGYFTVLGSRLVGPSGTVIAVEPAPDNVALLRANLWRNGCVNARVLPFAAHVQRGHAQMVLSPGGGAGNWLQEGASEEPTMLVPCAPLDELLGGLHVDVVKTDAEGSDVFAVQGLRATIAANPGIVIVSEFWPTPTVPGDDAAARSLVAYADLGLRFALLSHDGIPVPTTGPALLDLAGQVPMVNIVMTRA